MTKALVNPTIISWALQRLNATHEEVAKKLNIKTERLISWEKEKDAQPSFSQAQKLADKLHIPLGYLFLSNPPQERLPIPDLRTLTDDKLSSPSSDFIELLADVLGKADWYYDYLKDEGAEPLPFVGKFTTKDDIKTVASDMATVLGIDEDLRSSVRNWEVFFTRIISAADKAGIIILRSGIVGNNTHRPLSVAEFRGFAISNELAPLIFINSKDSKAARIFTLGHELAHIWVGASGVSNPDLSYSTVNEEKDVEQFCNAVAAELFVPEDEIQQQWQGNQTIESNVQNLVRYFRISSVVLLRRAFDLGIITREDFFSAYRDEVKKWEKAKGGSGGSYIPNVLARNSNAITSAVVSSALDGNTLFRDAARLLNVKVKAIDTLAAAIGLK